MTTVVYLDIDRTLSPIEDVTTWADYAWVTGDPFPSIAVSPTLLTGIGRLPAELYYLTDWAPEDTPFFDQYLGRPGTHLHRKTTGAWPWWKLDVIDTHLTTRPDIDRVIFADDKLAEPAEDGRSHQEHLDELLNRHPQVTNRFTLHPEDGLLPEHLHAIAAFLAATPSSD